MADDAVIMELTKAVRALVAVIREMNGKPQQDEYDKVDEAAKS